MSAPGYKSELTVYLLSDTYCALVIFDLWHQLDIVKWGFLDEYMKRALCSS